MCTSSIVELVLDYVKSGKVPTHVKYLIYLDAYDTILLGDASKIDEHYDSYEAEFLTANTQINWPFHRELG